jgi:hypothetical protein
MPLNGISVAAEMDMVKAMMKDRLEDRVNG